MKKTTGFILACSLSFSACYYTVHDPPPSAQPAPAQPVPAQTTAPSTPQLARPSDATPGNLGRWSGEFHRGGENVADYAMSIPPGRKVTFRVTVRVNEAEFPDRSGGVGIFLLEPVTYQEIGRSPRCAAARLHDVARPNPNTCVWVFDGARRQDGQYVLRVTDTAWGPDPDRWIGYTIDADL